MSRHQRAIAALVLGVLTALPVSATACAELCDSAASGHAAHHGSGMDCEEMPPPSTEAQVSGISTHDCSTHDAGLRQVSAAAIERVACGASGSPAPSIVATAHASSATLDQVEPGADWSPPPRCSPPTTRPLVLRV